MARLQKARLRTTVINTSYNDKFTTFPPTKF